MRMRTGNTHLRTSLASDPGGTGDSLACTILRTLTKDRLCDVELVGKDDVPVAAPSYLLAAHSEVFEGMFYPDSGEGAGDDEEGGEPHGASERATSVSAREDGGPSRARNVSLPFATWDSINAAVEFLATRSLPKGLEEDPNECNLRTVCQMHFIGRIFHVPSLESQAYRTARLFMNKIPRLVCVAFDECVVATRLLDGRYRLPGSRDELNAYALE